MAEVVVVGTRAVNARDTEIILSNGVSILTNDDEFPTVLIGAADDRDVDIVTTEEAMNQVEFEMRWI